MRAPSVVLLLSGLVISVAGIVFAMLAVNNPVLGYAIALGIAAFLLILLGFEILRYAIAPQSREGRFFARSYRGVLVDGLILALAICLTIATVLIQHTSTALCQGRLSGGFPMGFICDSTGESPLNSVGKIDWADIDSLNSLGSFVDIFFYSALLWIASNTLPKLLSRTRVKGRPG